MTTTANTGAVLTNVVSATLGINLLAPVWIYGTSYLIPADHWFDFGAVASAACQARPDVGVTWLGWHPSSRLETTLGLPRTTVPSPAGPRLRPCHAWSGLGLRPAGPNGPGTRAGRRRRGGSLRYADCHLSHRHESRDGASPAIIAEGLGRPLNLEMITLTKVTAMDDAKHVEGPSPAHTGTDWDRLRTMTDEDIERAVENDPDAAPILTAKELRQFKPVPARIKR